MKKIYDDIICDYFISQFEKDLNEKGIDTVCFMGYGYEIDESDVKIGSEFYFSYLYHGRYASLRGGTVEACLKNCLLWIEDSKFNPFDRYKVIQKHKYFDCFVIDTEAEKLIPAKEKRVYVRIKNLRTNEITVLSEIDMMYSHRFCWVTLWAQK
jgi:hypothetical protein